MNDLMLNSENIKARIYEIRGVQVMLDRDLAIFYGCKSGTKEINQAVKRNIERFPEDFYFQLTQEEFYNLKSQLVTSSGKNFQDLKFQTETSSWNGHGGVRKLPYAFTEQGVAMLSSVLRSENASKVSVVLMRAFVAMRHYLIENKDVYVSLNNINNKLIEHDKKFDIIFDNFKIKEEKELVFFNGQIFDAYSKIVDILNEAKQELIIIDGYADKKVLDMIKDLNVAIALVVKTKTLLRKSELEKYNKQYNNLKVIYDNSWHDRYIILDGRKIYHLGASLNYVGKKTFNINLLEDRDVIKLLLDKLKMISN